jgi:SPP1 family predicted phage head-tail adaptor
MIGEMRDRITFMEPINQDLPGGGADTTYVPLFTDWAKAIDLSSSRTLQDNQMELQNGFQFLIRYRSALQPNKTHLIFFEGANYTINSIRQVKQNRERFIEIIAITNA